MKHFDLEYSELSSLMDTKTLINKIPISFFKLIISLIIVLNISHSIANENRHMRKVELLKTDLELHFEQYLKEFENSKNFLENGVLSRLNPNLSHFEKINILLGCLKQKKEIYDFDHPLYPSKLNYLNELPKRNRPVVSAPCTAFEADTYFNNLFREINLIDRSTIGGELYYLNFETNSKLFDGKVTESFFMNPEASSNTDKINTTAYAASYGSIAIPNGTTLTQFLDVKTQVTSSLSPTIIDKALEGPIIKGRSFLDLDSSIYGSTIEAERALKELLNEVDDYENLLDHATYISEQYEIFFEKLKEIIRQGKLANYLPDHYRHSDLKYYLDYIDPELLNLCS